MGHAEASRFLLDHWGVIHEGGPDELLNGYEDDEERLHELANNNKGGCGLGGGDSASGSCGSGGGGSTGGSVRPGGGGGGGGSDGKAAAVATGIDAGPESNVVVRRLVNQQETRGGNGALSLAIQNGHAEVALLLLRKGANPNQQNFLCVCVRAYVCHLFPN